MPAPANPVTWGVNEHKILSSNKYDTEVLVGTDQNLKPGTLLTRSGEFFIASWVDAEVHAVCKSTKVQEWANTSSVKILARLVTPGDTYVILFDDDIVEADIGKFYKITAQQLADESTASATVLATHPIQLVDIVWGRYWVVKIVE